MNLLDKYIKTKFVIYKINFVNGKTGYDKKYITKIFLNIWFDKYDTVFIEKQLLGIDSLIGYDMNNDYYLLSNGSKIMFNDDLANDFICYILTDELELTEFNYFIMELNLFEVEYNKFKTKLSVLIDKGYDVKTIQYLFEEFTKEPEINIL
jgi:hypothetical protein